MTLNLDLVPSHPILPWYPLGKNILGTPATVKRFTSRSIRDFILRNYTPDQIVICSVGNISNKKFDFLAQKYFSEIPSGRREEKRALFTGYNPTVVTRKKKIFQAHCVIGTTGYSFQEDKRYVLAFLNNILGGPMLSSRLSIALREKNGLTYQIESSFTPYSDTGIFTLYFGTDKKNLEKALELVDKECMKLLTRKLSDSQLRIAKTQLIGQLAIAQESKVSRMLAVGRSFLMTGHYISIDEIIPVIEAITADQLIETANEILAPERLSRLIFQS